MRFVLHLSLGHQQNNKTISNDFTHVSGTVGRTDTYHLHMNGFPLPNEFVFIFEFCLVHSEKERQKQVHIQRQNRDKQSRKHIGKAVGSMGKEEVVPCQPIRVVRSWSRHTKFISKLQARSGEIGRESDAELKGKPFHKSNAHITRLVLASAELCKFKAFGGQSRNDRPSWKH